MRRVRRHTTSSIWFYGKIGNKNCKKADCMREQGYPLPKKVKAGSAAGKRARAAAGGGAVKEEDEVINLDLNLSELIDIYGQRCAAPAPTPAASAPALSD